MPQSPKQMGDKIKLTDTAWEENAPLVKFAGMTHAQYKAAAQLSLDAREKVTSLEIQLQTARVNRDIADADINETILVVVNSMKGDPNYGEDSPLYAAMDVVTLPTWLV